MVRLTSIVCMLLMLLLTGMPQETAAQRKTKAKAARKAKAAKEEAGTDTLSAEARRRYDTFFLEAMMQRQKGNSTAAFDLLRYCTRLNPQAPEAYFYLAQYYSALKDKERMMQSFERAADLNPDNTAYLETLAFAYVGNGRYDEAITAMEKLTQKDKGRSDILTMLVRLYMQKDDYDNAIAALDRIELLEGKSERLSATKSEILVQKGDTRAAVEEIKRLADQYPNDLNYRAMYADMLLKDGRKQEATDIYQDILREEPDNSRAKVSLLDYWMEEGDTLRADSMTLDLLLSPATTSDIRTYLLRNEIGRSETQGGDSTRVLRLFRQVAAVPQEDADVDVLLVAYMGLKKMPQDSIRPVLERILLKEPDNRAARLQLVAYAWSDDDMQRVVSLCAAARQYSPDEMAFYYYQGMAYYQMDDYDNALDAMQNGIGVSTDESNPELVSDFYSVLGELLRKKGRNEEAYAAYDSCLLWKDDNLHCLNNYAYYLCEDGGDLEKAERMSYKTITAEPENANSLDTYAWILFRQKRYAEAKVYIDQALHHDTDSSAVILEHAGDIYALNGDMERAVALWQEAALKDPDNKVLIRKIKQKKYLKQ